MTAILAFISALTHFMLAFDSKASSAAARLILIVMAIGCLWCMRDLWRQPTLHVWKTVAVMYGAMLIVHSSALHSLLVPAVDASAHHHHSHVSATRPSGALMGAMHLLPTIIFLVSIAALVSSRVARPSHVASDQLGDTTEVGKTE